MGRSLRMLALSAACMCVSGAEVEVAATGKQAPANERFTDMLAREMGDEWTRVIEHRFTDELADGTLDLGILKCYLVQDHRFIDAFVVLLASMIAKARSLADRIPGAQFLGLITGQENTYFERSFEALGVDATTRESTMDAPPMAAFQGLMRDAAASGSLAEMLAVLVVAEWSYQSWGERVLPRAVSQPFYFREWVDLHSGPYFGSVVAYLRGLLDAEVVYLSPDELDAVRGRFANATRLEFEFFEHCYQ
mmetsp:Transcript_16535/g.42436  ORF Transcript_16535/g.42436 Transcript_16535/m.42436 type:complete len:250 (-) Transcript_16535:376-1125(-)